MKKIALITGASSGMGREFALQMDCHFHNIDEFWLVARREEKLKELADCLQHPCRIFPMDITKLGQLERLEFALRLDDARLCMLIQCAGYGIMGDFEHADRKETLGRVRLNCEALTELTHRLLPYMSQNACIILLASSAAFLPQADFAVYAASKSYVLSFGRALGAELKDQNIYVTSVCPGPVDTPFFERAEKNGSTLAIKKYVMATPEDVVAKALRDSYGKKSVSICGGAMQAFWVLTKLMPHGVLLALADLLKHAEGS